VPSQHDGKDAAVVAELAAVGKAKPWAYQAADSWEAAGTAVRRTSLVRGQEGPP
jgi:hypothetical protein